MRGTVTVDTVHTANTDASAAETLDREDEDEGQAAPGSDDDGHRVSVGHLENHQWGTWYDRYCS